jgi:hypothetical protein
MFICTNTHLNCAVVYYSDICFRISIYVSHTKNKWEWILKHVDCDIPKRNVVVCLKSVHSKVAQYAYFSIHTQWTVLVFYVVMFVLPIFQPSRWGEWDFILHKPYVRHTIQNTLCTPVQHNFYPFIENLIPLSNKSKVHFVYLNPLSQI